MPPADLVRPLEAAFQDVVDAVLQKRRAPTTQDVAALGPRVAALSHAYNAGLAGDGARVKVPLEARIAFSFARDVPKGAAAVRELVRTGALAASGDRTLRIVDLGAGLGAMTWGVARALAAAARASGRPPARIEALLVDEDAEALAAASALAAEITARLGEDAPPLTIRTRVERLAPGMKLPEADLLILGQVLSELDVALEPAARVVRHAALVADLLAHVVEPDGALVIVEPALRERTRHLHAVRDRLVAAGTTVFAPCLHALGCPMLATEGEWCHEDLPVDLPPWVVPLARAAGLRWQRLTFAYLVLRRDAQRLVDRAPPPAPEGTRVHLRVVSELMRSKGKAEIFACTAEGARVRMRRLDRDAVITGAGASASAAWASLGRGAVVTVAGAAPIDERGRIDAAAEIDVWPTGK
jgi:ribosomal protein RSM22 (predicted rRNA methylase)